MSTIRKAILADSAELITLINRIFFTGDPRTFETVLPNLYCDPAIATRDAYLAIDGGRIVGHVGVYPLRLRVGDGLELSAGGIGAVATETAYRGTGVMSAMLNAAIEGMKASGYQLSVLWGDRMRYQHFGWELAGCRVDWKFNPRMATAAGFAAVALRSLDQSRDLPDLLQAWNSDSIGTIHTADSLHGLLMRKNWTTLVADEPGPFAFATVQWEGNDLLVDKLVASSAMAPRMLLALAELAPHRPAVVRAQCPTSPHPLAELAARFASEMVTKPVCNLRVIAPGAIPELQQAMDPAGVRRVFGTPSAPAAILPFRVESIAAV